MSKKVDLPEEATKAAAPKAKKKKRLTKVIDGTVLSITEAVTDTTLTCDFAELPGAIQALLGPFGMSQKLGDAAAGKKGQDAVDAIAKVWEGLMAGNWSVRAPAAAKITKGSIQGKIDAMPEGPEKELAKTLLADLLK